MSLPFSYRDLKGVPEDDLLAFLHGSDWTPTDNSTETDLDVRLQCLDANLGNVIDALAPIKWVVPRRKRPPWIGDGLLRPYKRRDATYRRTDALVDRNSFRSSGICRGKTMKRLDPRVPLSTGVELSVSRAQMPSGVTSVGVNLVDITIAISHFSSLREDGIPHGVVFKVLFIIGLRLVGLFNISLAVDTFTALWRNELISVKPIALLSFLSKVPERIASGQIIDHVTRDGIIDPLQTV